MTQAKLATTAGVSTPTVSNFENGDENVQVASALKIFSALGMIDSRNLIFDNKEEILDSKKQVIIFWGKDGNKEVMCQISREALQDYFEDSKDLIKIFKKYQERIEFEARRKYLIGNLDSDGVVSIYTKDLV